MFRGNVVSLHIAQDAAVPMESKREVKVVVGQGLEGDRYFNGTGHWSKHPGVSREVTLIEIETIEALESEKSIAIAPGAARRNVVTRGCRSITLWNGSFRSEPCASVERGCANPAPTWKV